jgi:hypothetical protein
MALGAKANVRPYLRDYSQRQCLSGGGIRLAASCGSFDELLAK